MDEIGKTYLLQEVSVSTGSVSNRKTLPSIGASQMEPVDSHEGHVTLQ